MHAMARGARRSALPSLVVLTVTVPLSLPAALIAQTGSIAGKVVDRATQRPLTEARVVVPGTALKSHTNELVVAGTAGNLERKVQAALVAARRAANGRPAYSGGTDAASVRRCLMNTCPVDRLFIRSACA